MIHRLRHIYRKALLKFIPARSYVLEVNLSQQEIIQRLHSLIHAYPFYFLFQPPTDKPYSGKMMINKFIAIRNHTGSFQRPIKVTGYFHIIQDKVFVRIILSNPFSLFNITILGVLYLLFIIFQVAPFEFWVYNVLLYLFPLLIAYLITNFSFQSIYKQEKLRFLKLFNGRRLTDKELEQWGI
jgi:hypothetical protein